LNPHPIFGPQGGVYCGRFIGQSKPLMKERHGRSR
jgi:hypothetical protein